MYSLILVSYPVSKSKATLRCSGTITHHHHDPDQHHLCVDSPVCALLRGRVLGMMCLCVSMLAPLIVE